MGGSIGIVLLFFYMAYRNPSQIAAGLYVPIFALVGALLGLVTGSVICACSFVVKKDVGILLRSVIGICLMLILAWSLGSTAQTSFYEGSSLAWRVLDWLAIILLLGVLPAVFARTTNQSKEPGTSLGRA